MSDDFDPTEPADGLTVLGGIVAVVGVVLPWVTVDAGPVDPASPGYETAYGLLAAVVAIVVLVAVVAGPADRRGDVSLLGGAVVSLVAIARYLTLDGAASAGIGISVTLLAGFVVVLGGVLGR